jgi:NAD-dependent DNA ligase
MFAIEGIADVKAHIFVEGIAREALMIDSLVDFFDEILPSKIDIDTSSAITGKSIVFTGTMLTAKRSDNKSS